MILQGQVAVVTAAGSGIGRDSAEILAREGATVIVSDISRERTAETVERILAAGGKAHACPADVTDDTALKHLIDSTVANHGRLDILHSHAGVQVEGELEQVTVEGMDSSWRLNVRSHFVAAKQVMPVMRGHGKGSIIVTSSNSGVFYDKGMLAYITTKAAVIAMVKQIAVDYSKYNVRINALCPGWVDTPFNDPYMRQMGGRAQLEAYVREQIPMGRWATVEEIAQSVLFLASDQSAFMTGQAMVIDGGESL